MSTPPIIAPEIDDTADRATDAVRYVEEPRQLVGGNAAFLLHNGADAFPAMLEAIAAARERISMEMYIFNDGVIGDRFANALAAAAARGVNVRLLYDFIGSRDASPDFFARLRERGVHVIAYHVYRLWRPRFWVLFRRNHRKTLVVDGQRAFTGGINVSDEWLARSEGGDDWRDLMVELRGPAVSLIERSFAAVWNRRARKRLRLTLAGLQPAPAAGTTQVAVIANTERRDRFAIRRTALHAIREARRRIYLANPYFVPDPGILRALRRAAARGVDVRVLVPERSDFRFLDYAARATFVRLLRDGVRIFQHQAVVHSKVLVVDDVFFSIGSYNFDHRSLAYTLELVVNIIDPATATAAAVITSNDMADASEIDRAAFARRPFFARLVERIAYRLRHWL